jgi:serine protease Do
MTRASLKSTPLVLALMAAGIAGGAGVELAHRQGQAHAAPAAAATPARVSGQPDFAALARQHGPAVVNISVVGTRKVGHEQNVDPSDPSEFFRRFQPGPGAQPDRPVRGNGSGFIVDANGIVLTNAHVVQDAQEVTVKLTDRREFVAKVLGSDARTDVAVLKIDARDLPVAKLGKTSSLSVGDWVLAIGSPFGFENTVTAGVVSAKGRSLPDGSGVPFLQTDVAINPGNSGGPLFNAQGEVVGINSQIYSRSGGYQGVSFAIPIDVANRVKDQIVATGKAEHARLGVAVQEVNQALADSFKLPRPQGALVSKVDAGGPAEKAGLKAGDVIQSVNGQPVVASGDLPAHLGQLRPGERVKLKVWRNGSTVDVAAQLGNASAPATKAASGAAPEAQAGRLGLALRPIESQERQQLGVSGGLRVEGVSGPAEAAGVQAGDVVVSINGTAVSTVESARAATQDAKNVALLIQRDGQSLFVPLRVG